MPRLALAALLLALPAAAHATPTFYSLTSNPLNLYFTYYPSPVLITADTTFTPTACEIFNGDCASVEINPPGGTITITSVNGNSTSIDQLPSSFFALGSHETPDHAVQFDISQDPNPTSPVPEPSTLALLATGLAATLTTLRRRRA